MRRQPVDQHVLSALHPFGVPQWLQPALLAAVCLLPNGEIALPRACVDCVARKPYAGVEEGGRAFIHSEE